MMNTTTARLTNKVLEAAIVLWAIAQRQMRGDLFATETELESIKGDPLGFADLLKGADAYDFVHYVQQAAMEADGKYDALVLTAHTLANAYGVCLKLERTANNGIDMWSRRHSNQRWYHHGLFGTDTDERAAKLEIEESISILYGK